MMGIGEGTCWDEHWVLYVMNHGDLLPKQRAHFTHCMLINLFIGSNSFLMMSLGLFVYKIMSSSNSDNVTFPFQFR